MHGSCRTTISLSFQVVLDLLARVVLLRSRRLRTRDKARLLVACSCTHLAGATAYAALAGDVFQVRVISNAGASRAEFGLIRRAVDATKRG